MGIKLKGITWNHSRGFTSVAATAQRYSELNNGVEIQWQKRSLQAFADAPITELAEQFDLLVIDHPWAGFAANSGILADLSTLLDDAFLADQAENSVGNSHQSYQFDGFQSALAIDAATPVATYRPDLIKARDVTLPRTWSELLALAKSGQVIIPGIPIDSLMNFYMLCVTLGEAPFLTTQQVVSPDTGVRALEMLRELMHLCPSSCAKWNPIKVYEAMTQGDEFLYCPFAYAYANYSRSGYAPKQLQSAPLVEIEGHGRLRSTLGGTGLAISSRCQHLEVAADYVAFTAAPETQRGIFYQAGGQPGHRQAWLDDEVNRSCRGFFKTILADLDNSFLRPRYNGYLEFQDHAGGPVFEYLHQGGNPLRVMDQLNQLYLCSQAGGES